MNIVLNHKIIIKCSRLVKSAVKALFLICLLGATPCLANHVMAEVYTADAHPKALGNIDFRDTSFGLLITPNVTSLSAGLHGFHLHQHANCNDQAMAAGGHFDPKNTNTHQGPYGNGHLGDLPVLYVSADGQGHTPILAPRFPMQIASNVLSRYGTV